MRHAVSFGLVFLASLSTGALFLACGAGDKEDPPGSRGTGGGAGYDLDTIFGKRDASPDVPLGGKDAGGGGVTDGGQEASTGDPDASKPVTCESCGSAQSVTQCGSALTACRANAGCKRIYDCIYTYRGCGLTSSDIGCIQGCLDDYCDDEKSVALYLAYDQCTYCSDACEEACGSYCSGFPNSGMIPTRCTDGVASDAGSDAAPTDAGTPDANEPSDEDGGVVADAGPDVSEPEDAGPEPVCVPGQQVGCACVGGAQGAQVCNSEGTGYGPCYCPPRPDGGEGGSGGSGGDDDDEEEDDEEDDD